VRDTEVPLPDAWANRVLAVNLLHEVRGETALAEMRRLLAPEGQLLVVDWERGGERAFGPPDHLLYSADEAHEELASAGFAVERLELGLPFHFALRTHPAAQPTPDPSDRS
jgi:SAM-dependent methyltransferase